MVLSFDAMLALITAFSIITSLATQFVKKILDTFKVQYASNIVVFVVSAAVGGCGTGLYYVNHQIPLNALTSVYLAIMSLSNCMGAMLGYDKVKQVVTQIKEINMQRGV